MPIANSEGYRKVLEGIGMNLDSQDRFDLYLKYLKSRLNNPKRSRTVAQHEAALAEYSRAVAFGNLTTTESE